MGVRRVAVRSFPRKRPCVCLSMHLEAATQWWILQGLHRSELSGVAYVLSGMSHLQKLANLLFEIFAV